MSEKNPEIAKTIQTGKFKTNYHDQGEGEPVFLIHGSGPGVTAWANWRLVIPELAKDFRVVAPDMAGFGYTERLPNDDYNMENWVNHAISLMDALGIERTNLVGNSFGGALALALAIKHPERVNKLLLMGSVGVHFDITPGLDAVWGYEPSIENMRKLLDIFAFNRELVSDELAELRYQASIRPGFQESFSAMFPAPRQRWVDAMMSSESEIKKISHETLIVHGREDEVIPLSTSLKLFELIENSQLHLFGRCGHWTQIEHTARFNRLVRDFFLNT
ncbi:MAG: 2-hydroxy-6-oxo-2,4-heptadienoate hydrolase [Gammaproteobacteria bacterium]|nr:MAG: 2-hydroxy-6-oxo-2,4-heptadienoate hydrolase [Gammaproteobacteria bacterium]RLA24512.1 MAG: 2-hydroxy-6-oxo-2,4-heptadienoate hydrolase [Gammaproteobacteria bacterium]